MFSKEIIHVEYASHIRYGTTKLSFQQTMSQIMALLNKHGCNKIATAQDGEIRAIQFIYQEKLYEVTFPRVYVKKVYNDRIGIRIVKYYLEIILDLAKDRAIDFEGAMLGSKMVQIGDRSMTVKDAVDHLDPAELFLPMSNQDFLED